MANKRITDLNEKFYVDGANDFLIVEDVSANETKKTRPQNLPLSSRAESQSISQTIYSESTNSFVGYYENIDTSIYWNLYVANPGKYNVTLYQSCPKDKAGSSFELQVPGSQLKGIIKGTNNWTDYTRVELGVINIPHPGTQKFIFKPTQINHGVLANIKSIVLQRLK